MAGLEETFFAVGADATVSALVDDVRPAFVFDRSGTRLLWANAAGILSLGADIASLLARHFPSSSPLARRISVVAGQLSAGQSRTDRITLPRGLVPSPVLCRVTRIAVGEHRGVLVTDLESRSRIADAGEARERYAALSASLVPQQEPIDEALAEEVPEAGSARVSRDASVEAAASAAPDAGPPEDEFGDVATEPRPEHGSLAEDSGSPEQDDATDADHQEAAERFVAETVAIDASTEGPGADEEPDQEPPAPEALERPDVESDETGPIPANEGVAPVEFADWTDDAALAGSDVEHVVGTSDGAESAMVAGPEWEDGPGQTSGTDAGPESIDANAEESNGPEANASEIAGGEPVETEALDPYTAAAESTGTGTPAAEPATDDGTGAEPPTGFAFPQHGRSIRFVFELSPSFEFSFVSPDLGESVGADTAPRTGEAWPDLATRLDLDPSGRVLQALRRHDTFTGITVDWPVEGAALRVPVDLAGMPVFARDRAFRGYRGFGIAKTGAAFAAAPEVATPTAAPASDIELPAEEATATAEAPALLDDVEPVVLHDAFGHADAFVADEGTLDEYLEAGMIPAPAESGEPAEADAPGPTPDGSGAFDPFSTADEETDPRDLSPDGETEARVASFAAERAMDTAPAVLDGRSDEIASVEPEWVETQPVAQLVDAVPAVADDEAEVLPATEGPSSPDASVDGDASADASAADWDVDPDAEAMADEPLLSAEEAPAIVVDSEPEVVHDITSRADDGDDFRAPDSQTLSAAEAELYAGEMQPTEEAASDDVQADVVDALPGEDASDPGYPVPPAADEGAADANRSDDDQPSDDVLEALAADETPEGSVFDSATDEDQLYPDDEQDESDLVWQERSGEIIQSPVIARPIPPEAPLTPEEAERRQLSRPEREAFQKIAEALGARVEDGARQGGPGRRDVMRVAPSKHVPDDAPAAPIDSAILDRLPVPLAILKNGDAVLVNRAFLELSGYESAADLDARGGFAEAFVGSPVARQGGLPAIRRQDGSTIAVEARLHSVTFNGGIASLVVVQPTTGASPAVAYATPPSQDIDARSRELEAILDTATDGVLVIDERGMIVGANRSAEALFGTERETLLGAPLVDMLAPESHRAALDYLDGLARNGVASVLNDGREVIGRVQQGGLVPLFMTMGRVSPGRFCAVLRDITQWKRAEEELTNAKRSAENASSQKSDFLAKISHEIRTPLNAIIGFSEVMMEERFGAVGSDRYKEYLRDIHSSGTLIMSLVNDLLDLSKIEAGKLDLSFEAVALNDVLRECVALMQPQANRERVIIRTSLSSTVPNVVADPRSLRQIVLNLLSNAIKFNSAGGQVIVSTIYEDSGEVAIRVRDTGPGMSADDLERALEPFRQLHTSRPARGTGLGLPLTKALVEANRAAFRIDSTVGQGTLVQITFPSTRVLAE
ncbi:ATP-binding protein [Chthonobacter albigriseus]|uniref:ATP-binding protein n=1 Tax=Chthonobacter albigriseus TaxID=1683161 RepID=UPI0015EF36B2|nr:ATP-binding protein [Chthonobacter albigriseus]